MLHFVTGMQLKQGVPETHTKIQATQHGCLPSLPGNAMGTRLTWAAKAGQKISCTGTACPMNQPMKEPFHMYSLSPHSL